VDEEFFREVAKHAAAGPAAVLIVRYLLDVGRPTYFHAADFGARYGYKRATMRHMLSYLVRSGVVLRDGRLFSVQTNRKRWGKPRLTPQAGK
jgi:DNA-binding IclR family transcriptional regulator